MSATTNEPLDADDLAAQWAEVLLALRRHGDALRIATTLVASRPQDPRTWTLLARCQLAAGAHAAAVVSARQAIALAPDNARVHAWASNVPDATGKRNLALDIAQEAVRLAPDLVAAHAAVAMRAAEIAPRGDVASLDHFLWQQARWHAHVALRLDPADTEAIFAAAYVNLRSGQYAKARRGFRAVLAVDPTDQAAQNNLAVLEMNRMRLGRAGKALAGLAAADPGDQRVLRNVGRVAIRQLAAAHGVFWMLYVCSTSAAAIAPAGPLQWRWTWRGLVVVSASVQSPAVSPIVGEQPLPVCGASSASGCSHPGSDGPS
ncbi:MAG: hypothetical protein QOE76_995 [Frankiales bacterium]|nr:hypothetical protein [Frankiales bacterium]